MASIGGMPRRTLVYSALFHVAVAGVLYGLYHFHFLDREIAEDTPLVVEIVNPSELTRATEVNVTPPKPDKPKEVAKAEPPKPEPPKPEPPKPEPPPPPPPPPEPPKPEPPKPEPPPPPKPEAKPEPPKPAPAPPPPKPQPPKRKDDDAAFDTLLKNLAKRDPARADQSKLAIAEPPASKQPVAPLGSQLTTSELDVVKRQIEGCWLEPLGARDVQTLVANIRIYMNPDATVRNAEIIDHNNLQFAESALRAALNPSCHQLKLPLDKYGGANGWNIITLTFTPKGVL